MSDLNEPDEPLSDDGEVGHLAEDVGLTDAEFEDVAGMEESGAGRAGPLPAPVPPD